LFDVRISIIIIEKAHDIANRINTLRQQYFHSRPYIHGSGVFRQFKFAVEVKPG